MITHTFLKNRTHPFLNGELINVILVDVPPKSVMTPSMWSAGVIVLSLVRMVHVILAGGALSGATQGSLMLAPWSTQGLYCSLSVNGSRTIDNMGTEISSVIYPL